MDGVLSIDWANYIFRLCKETAEEMSRIERKRAMVTREINKIKANTAAFKQSGLDVKYVTDQLMARAVR